MLDGDLTMFESGAMVQYILDRYGNGALQPQPGTPEHALYLQWSWFAEATFARPLGEIVNHRRVFSEPDQNPAAIAEMQRKAPSVVADCFRMIEAELIEDDAAPTSAVDHLVLGVNAMRRGHGGDPRAFHEAVHHFDHPPARLEMPQRPLEARQEEALRQTVASGDHRASLRCRFQNQLSGLMPPG